jgi:hypothetical protein
MSTNPNENLTVHLKSTMQHSGLFAKSLSIMAIIMEALAGVTIFRKPQNFFSHLLLIGMIISIFFFRLETGFLALLSTMGLLLSPSKKTNYIYLVLIMIFLILMATGLGLR